MKIRSNHRVNTSLLAPWRRRERWRRHGIWLLRRLLQDIKQLSQTTKHAVNLYQNICMLSYLQKNDSEAVLRLLLKAIRAPFAPPIFVIRLSTAPVPLGPPAAPAAPAPRHGAAQDEDPPHAETGASDGQMPKLSRSAMTNSWPC